MLTLVAGSGMARLIGFSSIPILTRIYSPEDYGTLALFISFVAILAPFATLKYSTAIPLPKTDAMAINLLVLGILLIGALSSIIGMLLLFFGGTFLSWFGAAELAKWWWLIVLAVAGSAAYELFSMWSTRKRRYLALARTQFSQSLIGNLAKIALGLLALQPFGLIFGQFLAQSFGVGSLIKNSIQDIKSNLCSINPHRLKLVAAYYRQFPYFRLPSQSLLSLSAQAPILMMASLFDKESTGQLSLAMVAIALPGSLIGGAMAKAFYAEIAFVGKKDLKKIKRITVDVQKKLFIIGVPLTGMAVLLAEPLFKVVFGQKWEVAGQYAAILAPYVLLQFTSNPLMQVLNIVGSQLTFLLVNVLRLAGLVALLLVIKMLYPVHAQGFVISISAYLALYYLVMTFFIMHIVNRSVIAQEKN